MNPEICMVREISRYSPSDSDGKNEESWKSGLQKPILKRVYSKTFPRNTASFFIFFEEGSAAAIYDMRRLQYGRGGELREKDLLAPDCCQCSFRMKIML